MSPDTGVGFPEFEPDNQEPRQPCILLLDVSGSMGGDPIKALNEGLVAYKEELEADPLAQLRVETGIVTFGGRVETAHGFATVDEFNPPHLLATGGTPMGEAIETALDMLEDRKRVYRDNDNNYFRPWLFLITDGAPTDSVTSAKALVRDFDERKKVNFFAVGVEGANMTKLAEISPPHRAPLKLDGLKFRELFKWLSGSLRATSSGNANSQVALLPYDGWATVGN